MADKTDEDHLNNPTDSQPEKPSNEIIPAKDKQSVKPEQEIENMEVHHHAHHEGKKNWRSYVWEFLMLFLAVFCGFLAEYQLEHKIESDRAKELAKNFFQELKGDSVNVRIKTEYRVKQENALSYLMKYFKDSSLTSISKTFELNFQYGINFRSPSLFEPRTVILEQLKNSGSLRYFKNDELQRLIGDISIAIHNINDRQDLEGKVRIEYINPLIIRHYDFDFDSQLSQNGKVSIIEAMAKYEKSNEVIPFQFKSIEKFDKQGTINALGFYRSNALSSTRTLHFQKYMELNAKLLQVLRDEYHLK